MKEEDAFGHKQYKKAAYNRGTRLTCAEMKRIHEYEDCYNYLIDNYFPGSSLESFNGKFLK